jgi:hypothetical protein
VSEDGKPSEPQVSNGEAVVVEPAAETDARCEAVTTVGGNLYRCSLGELHEGEHAFAPLELEEPDETSETEQAASADNEEIKALQRAVKNYGKAVVGILGTDLGPFAICPCCSPLTPGLYIEHEHTDEEIYALRNVLGLPDISTYAKDTYSKQCEVCKGRRRVLSGALDGPEVTLECLECKGRGWVPVGNERDKQLVPPAAAFDNAAADPSVEPAPVLPPAAQAALRQMLDAADLARVSGGG